MKKLLRWFLKYYESLPTVDRYARHGRAINVVVQELTSVAASEKITPTDIRVSYIDDELDMNLQTLYHMTIGVINSDTSMKGEYHEYAKSLQLIGWIMTTYLETRLNIHTRLGDAGSNVGVGLLVSAHHTC